MWYHVTDRYFGKKEIFVPRLPRDGSKFIIEREGDVPRICVSNSIFKCLRAIHGTEDLNSSRLYFSENPCVYFTEEVPYLPPNCTDFRANDERWFIKKTEFFYLARVDMYKLFLYNTIVATQEEKLKLPKHPIVKSAYQIKERFIQSLMGVKND